jgi:hypothetical protein
VVAVSGEPGGLSAERDANSCWVVELLGGGSRERGVWRAEFRAVVELLGGRKGA